MERLILCDDAGMPVAFTVTSSAPTLGWVGPYEVRDLRIAARRGDIHDGTTAAVICPPDMRKPGRWNYTLFELRDGLLEPRDVDVELDPYHMCLLYQLITGARDG